MVTMLPYIVCSLVRSNVSRERYIQMDSSGLVRGRTIWANTIAAEWPLLVNAES